MKRLSLLPLDTSLEAARVQFSVLRRMGQERRAALTLELSDSLREVLTDGVRHRNPAFTEEQVRAAVLRLTLGDALCEAAVPSAEAGAR